MSLEPRRDGNILLLCMANPPVNSLSWELRKQLHQAFTAVPADTGIDAVILCGTGKYFCAGGDLKELGTAAGSAPPRLSADVLTTIERCGKPVIAAIHGAAIGGGFELALACHHRIVLADARIALPEVQHGIIPLSGTLRLPRLWGMARALPMMLDSQFLTAADFAGSAVFDRIVPAIPEVQSAADEGTAECGGVAGPGPAGSLLPLSIEFARSLVGARVDPAQKPLGRGTDACVSAALVRNRPFSDADPGAELRAAIAGRGAEPLTTAQSALIAAVQGGIEIPDFDAALKECHRIYDVLTPSRATFAPSGSPLPFASKRT